MFDSDAWLEAAYDDRNGALVDSDDPPEGWGWLPCNGAADCEGDLHERPCRSLIRPASRIACPACTAEVDEPCRESCVARDTKGQMHD